MLVIVQWSSTRLALEMPVLFGAGASCDSMYPDGDPWSEEESAVLEPTSDFAQALPFPGMHPIFLSLAKISHLRDPKQAGPDLSSGVCILCISM